MRMVGLTVGIILAANQTALAQNSIRLLTATEDSCLAFTVAMDQADQTRLLPLAGWALGFFSGFAQGTGIDYLRSASTQDVMTRLYDACRNEPNKALSVASEEMALELIHHSVK